VWRCRSSLLTGLARRSRATSLARSGYFGVHCVGKVTWAVGRVENIEPGGEQPNLRTECVARPGAKRGQEVGFCCPEAIIEAAEEFVALWGGHDPAGAPVRGIRAALDQAGGFEVIEKVGHDRTVHSEVLGQGELAGDGALRSGGKHLVAPRTSGKIGHRGMGRLDIGPKNHTQAPSEIVGQRVCAARGCALFVPVTSDLVHEPIIRAEPRSVGGKILCISDVLARISL